MIFFISVSHSVNVCSANGNNRFGRQTNGGISFLAELAAIDTKLIVAVCFFKINRSVFNGNYNLRVGIKLNCAFAVNCREVNSLNCFAVNAYNCLKLVCLP